MKIKYKLRFACLITALTVTWFAYLLTSNNKGKFIRIQSKNLSKILLYLHKFYISNTGEDF
jgi:hypothetical protein